MERSRVSLMNKSEDLVNYAMRESLADVMEPQERIVRVAKMLGFPVVPSQVTQEDRSVLDLNNAGDENESTDNFMWSASSILQERKLTDTPNSRLPFAALSQDLRTPPGVGELRTPSVYWPQLQNAPSRPLMKLEEFTALGSESATQRAFTQKYRERALNKYDRDDSRDGGVFSNNEFDILTNEGFTNPKMPRVPDTSPPPVALPMPFEEAIGARMELQDPTSAIPLLGQSQANRERGAFPSWDDFVWNQNETELQEGNAKRLNEFMASACVGFDAMRAQYENGVPVLFDKNQDTGDDSEPTNFVMHIFGKKNDRGCAVRPGRPPPARLTARVACAACR